MQQPLSLLDRQGANLRYVEIQPRVSITQVCDHFVICLAIARRDLEALARDGKLERMGSATTVVEVACHLHDNGELIVIINSLLVMNTLAGAKSITALGLGGELPPSEKFITDHQTPPEFLCALAQAGIATLTS